MSEPDKALADLISRVEKATGPNITLDFAVHDAIYGPTSVVIERYTFSLDAVVALVERELNAHDWAVGIEGENNRYWARIEDDVWDEAMGETVAYGKTHALALLLCFLRAKAGQQPDER